MTYKLSLDENNRIVYFTLSENAPAFLVRVNYLPDLQDDKYLIQDFKYIDGQYIYDPIPKPIPDPQPTKLDLIEAQVLYTALMTDTVLENS